MNKQLRTYLEMAADEAHETVEEYIARQMHTRNTYFISTRKLPIPVAGKRPVEWSYIAYLLEENAKLTERLKQLEV